MHTVFALLCFNVVIHWLIFPYPSGLLHWHCGNLTIAPVPAKQPWWIWINTSCEFIMNECITTKKQSTTKPCAYFLGYTVGVMWGHRPIINGISVCMHHYIHHWMENNNDHEHCFELQSTPTLFCMLLFFKIKAGFAQQKSNGNKYSFTVKILLMA